MPTNDIEKHKQYLEYQRQYRIDHKEELSKKEKQYRLEHLEQIRAQDRERFKRYNENHPEHKEYKKRYMYNYNQIPEHKAKHKINTLNDYYKHKEKRIAKTLEWQKQNSERYKEIRIKSKEKLRLERLLLLGNKCEHCSNIDTDVLQIHHKNGLREGKREYLNKNFNISEYMLLCANCHIKEHSKEFKQRLNSQP